MNLPNSFKFKTMIGRVTFTATEVGGNNFEVTNSDGKVITSITLIKMAQKLGKGEWKIIDEPKTDYETIAQNIGKLVAEKNKQYGDSFNKSGDILKILYPDGVQPEQYKDMQAIARIIDKLMRIANGNQGEENAFRDIAGYGILKCGGNE